MKRPPIRTRRTGVLIDFACLTSSDLDTLAWFALLLHEAGQ